MTLVSVLIPCYNAAPWIAAALDSVLAQPGVDLDVLVVDDGSRDGSAEIVEAYESRGVRLIRQRNRGAGAARNAALRAARGTLLQFLDADDLLGPGKLVEQSELLSESQAGRVALSRTIHFLDGTRPDDGALHDNGPVIDSTDAAEWLIDLLGPDGQGSMAHPAAYLVPREVADRAGPWQEFASPDDDGEFFGRVLLASTGVVRSAPAVSYYRKFRSETSLSARRSAELNRGALRSLDLRSAALLAVRDTVRARRALARSYLECAVLAYPTYADVSGAALARIEELGGTDYVPALGGSTLHFIRDVFGWRVARRLSVYWQRLKRREARV